MRPICQLSFSSSVTGGNKICLKGALPPSEMVSIPLPRCAGTREVHTDTRNLKSLLDVYIQVIRHVKTYII
jgi:hypothetical protein